MQPLAITLLVDLMVLFTPPAEHTEPLELLAAWDDPRHSTWFYDKSVVAFTHDHKPRLAHRYKKPDLWGGTQHGFIIPPNNFILRSEFGERTWATEGEIPGDVWGMWVSELPEFTGEMIDRLWIHK